MKRFLKRLRKAQRKEARRNKMEVYQGGYSNYRTPTGWRVKKEDSDGTVQCSLIKTPTVYIEPIVRHKIELLMKEYPYQEWLGYLIGKVSEKENFFVENLSVPPHKEASGASAEAEPFHKPNNCVGVIHSHHTMGAFHSGTDQNYVDKNFPISITVARKNGELEYDAVSHQITQCGKGITTKCSVKYVLPKPTFDTEGFLKKAKANVEKGKKVYTYTPPYNYPGTGIGFRPPEPRVPHYTVDSKGNVMSQKDIDDVMNNIWD